MAATTTSQLDQSVVAAHLQTEFLMAVAHQDKWDQFTWVPENGAVPPGADITASSVQVVVYKNLDLISSTIPEAIDIEGVQMADTSVSVSMGEYGNAVQDTQRLRALARTDVPAAIQIAIGRNAGLSQDMLARAAYLGGGHYRRPTAGATRATLSTIADDLQAAGYTFMYSLAAHCRSVGAPTLGDSSETVTHGLANPEDADYATVVHSLVIGDMQELNGWTPLQYIAAPEARESIYNGRIAKLAGIQIIESELGKVYQSAGTTAQAATSLDGAHAADAASIDVVDATGIVAGDIITIGTLETGVTDTTTLESVMVTSVSTNGMLVQGTGPDGGLRWAHATAAPVTEATFVGAIPVFGGMSVAKIYSTAYGAKPAMVETGPFDKLGRFKNYGWKWLGGYGRMIPAWVIRGEVALNGKNIMCYGI